jgi:hypothetical protein
MGRGDNGYIGRLTCLWRFWAWKVEFHLSPEILLAIRQTHTEATRVLNVVGLKDIPTFRFWLSCCCDLSLMRFTGPVLVARVIQGVSGFWDRAEKASKESIIPQISLPTGSQ